MSNLKKALLASTLLLTTVTPALAEMPEGLSANISVVSDYRFRGVSRTDKDPAMQIGVDYEHDSGFYVGTWASNVEENFFNDANVELDFYGGYAGEVGMFSYDVGALMYYFPSGENTDYVEAYGSIGVDFGVASATFGANYALSTDNLGNQDSIYLYTDLYSQIPDTDFGLNAHFGYEDGAFGNDKLDWSLGVSYTYERFEFSVNYVDTDIDHRLTDANVVVGVSVSF